MRAVRTPQQARGKQTRNSIIKAAMQLFARKGIHGTNSKEIAEKAGVSIGSFYSYFKNKKVLLLEMLEEYLDAHYSRIWDTLENQALERLERGDIRAIIENVFAAYDISPEFHRQTHALRYSDPDINRIYDRERNREVKQITALLGKNRPHLRVEDLPAAAVIIQNAVENVAHTAKFIGPSMDDQRLIEALTDMIHRFVLGD